MTDQNNEQLNSLWFDFYTKEIDSSPNTGYKKFGNYFLCPCCHFPTLTERQSFEICMLCNWEDDGQDDHNADKILGGPNKDYSLSEARQNFIKYFTQYRPSDTPHFERTTIKKTFDGQIILDLTEIKKQIITKYNLAMASNNEDVQKQLLTKAIELGKKLH